MPFLWQGKLGLDGSYEGDDTNRDMSERGLILTLKLTIFIGRWQDFLSVGLPAGIFRMKGSIFFHEDADLPGKQWSFHMSGRQRYETVLESSGGEAFVRQNILPATVLFCGVHPFLLFAQVGHRRFE